MEEASRPSASTRHAKDALCHRPVTESGPLGVTKSADDADGTLSVSGPQDFANSKLAICRSQRGIMALFSRNVPSEAQIFVAFSSEERLGQQLLRLT